MFEQHPVPQNISSYQFHLVGDMTLKQFLELAAGVVVGVLFYISGLPGIIKWPLIFISVALGGAIAFVPLEERPLEQWIFAFFRSVYSPTLFHWEKRQGVKYYADETAVDAATQTTQLRQGFVGQGTSDVKVADAKNLEDTEKSYLSRLTGIFTGSQQVAAQPQPTQLRQGFVGQGPQIIPAAPVERPPVANPMTNYTGGVVTMNINQPTSEIQSNVQQKRDVQIPQSTFVSLDNHTRPQVVVQEIPAASEPTLNVNASVTGVTATPATAATANAQFSTDAAPPSVPTINNTVSGQVMTADGRIVESAVLEILDPTGRPVRALKTNRAGHFLNVTPLLPGKYKIVIEKEGYNFDPIEFEANNNIIAPIAIKANKQSL